MIIKKGTKKLVEVELLEDVDDWELLNILYNSKPITDGKYTISQIYFNTIEELKEKIKNSVTNHINNL